MEPNTIASTWGITKRIAFRFSFLFFGLFIFIQNNGAYPLWVVLTKYVHDLLHIFIPWLAKHVYHVPYDITVFTNGSGDTTYDYLIVLTILIVAIIGIFIWSLADRRRKQYNTLYYWLTTAMRFYVGLMLINYGLAKVVKLQFPSPDFFRLTQTYGDSSPMGLAWTFLGFSKGYNFFMGFAELAAILLLFRRTMTVGAIITLMTTSSVMAINYFYDVPVKILSTMLVVMTMFLLLNDAGVLIRFFFKGEKVSLPVIKVPESRKQWMRITKLSFKFLIIGFVLIVGFIQMKQYEKQYGENAPKPRLFGFYTVESFMYSGDTLPALTTEAVRWKQLFIQTENFAVVHYVNGSTGYFSAKVDTANNSIGLVPSDGGALHLFFRYEVQDSLNLRFSGKIGGDSAYVSMKRKELKDFPLMNRGFNWINEYPYNR